MSLDALNLTSLERRYLAMHARYESQRQEDPRYCAADREERERLRVRWREIADTLYPNPHAPLTDEERVITDKATTGLRQGFWGPDGEPQ